MARPCLFKKKNQKIYESKTSTLKESGAPRRHIQHLHVFWGAS